MFFCGTVFAADPEVPAPSPDTKSPAPAAPPSGAAPDAPSAGTAAPPAGGEAPPSAGASSGGEVSSGSGLFEAAQSDAGTSSGASEAPTTTGADFNGYVRGDAFVGKEQNQPHADMKAVYSELALKVRVRKEKFGDAYAEMRFRYGVQGDVHGLILDPREAYVNLYAGPLDLRLGQQIVVWGRADALNPTSNITPVDFRIHSPVEDDRRVGNVGARAFLNFQPLRLEGVWMPLYVPTELPPLPLPDRVNLGNPNYPYWRLENGTEAVRVHLELPAIEMSASYLYGYAPLPGLGLHSITPGTIEVNGMQVQGQGSATVSRTAYNQQVVGFDFATTLGDWLGLRGEAAYRDPFRFRDRVYAPNPDFQYVVGVDHTFGEVSVILQYLGRYTVNWQKRIDPHADPSVLDTLTEKTAYQAVGPIEDTLRAKNQILFSQLHRTQSMASARVEWLTLHQTLSLSALAFVNFSTQEWLLFPKVGYQLTDNLSATVGAELYQGPHDTLFGIIKSELSAGYVELRMAF
jgi:hypothetical protein